MTKLHDYDKMSPDPAAFLSYARGFYTGNPDTDDLLRLKEEHTLKVLENAECIRKEEAVFADPVLGRALLLGALYHDVARFMQFLHFRTFVDAISCNHGLQGVKEMKRQGFLDMEDPRTQRLAYAAVGCHNRFRAPVGLPEEYRTVLFAVRDADKLDVIRVLKGHLRPETVGDDTVLMGLKNKPGQYSPVVLEALEQGRVAAFSEMQVYNDFRLLLCTWLYDLNFRTSYGILADAGHLWEIIDSLDGIPAVRKRVWGHVNTIINRRMAS